MMKIWDVLKASAAFVLGIQAGQDLYEGVMCMISVTTYHNQDLLGDI